MPTHVTLLRGVNLAGRNKLAMSDLREVVASLGHRDVATYIQSGNVVFTADGGDTDELADELEAALAERTGVSCGVVVLSTEQVAAVIAANPFPDEADPRRLHAVFRRRPPDDGERAEMAAAEGRAREKGGRDELRIVGATVYLHTPDGLGRSELDTAPLARSRRRIGTARNWATVTKLAALLEG